MTDFKHILHKSWFYALPILGVFIWPGSKQAISDKALFTDSNRAILTNASEVRLFLLNKPYMDNSVRGTITHNSFQSHSVIGEGVHKNDAKVQRMLHLLYGSLSDHPITRCGGSPRHGIQATYNGEKVEITICFGCAGLRLFDQRGEHFSYVKYDARNLLIEIENEAGIRADVVPRRIVTQMDVELSKLRTIPFFATGGIYRDGRTSDGEAALQVILSRSNPVPTLKDLLIVGNNPGRLYALLGLKIAAPAEFKRAIVPFLTNASKVDTMSGCTGEMETMRSVARRIAKGQFQFKSASASLKRLNLGKPLQ